MPDGHYGWMQICGNGYVMVSDQSQPAYVDFRPNEVKFRLSEESSEEPSQPLACAKDEKCFDQNKDDRLSQLPPLLIEAGSYCELLREARDVFVDGHLYACVAMCGISFERFQRDKAEPYIAKSKSRMDNMETIRGILKKNAIISDSSLILCKQMASMRNEYAHGHGLNPEEDAFYSLQWMHSFLDAETNLMRGYEILNGSLKRTIQ